MGAFKRSKNPSLLGAREKPLAKLVDIFFIIIDILYDVIYIDFRVWYFGFVNGCDVMKNKYFFLIALVVLFIIFLFSLGIYYFQKPLITYKDSKENIIFTLKKHDVYSQNVPQVNLVGDDIQAINDNIILFVEDYYGKDGVSIGYDYSKNGTVLSLLVTIISKNVIESPEILFTSYHISLKDNRIISDEELLLKNGFSISDVEKLVDDAFLEYYFQSDISRYCDLDCFRNDLGKYY